MNKKRQKHLKFRDLVLKAKLLSIIITSFSLEPFNLSGLESFESFRFFNNCLFSMKLNFPSFIYFFSVLQSLLKTYDVVISELNIPRADATDGSETSLSVLNGSTSQQGLPHHPQQLSSSNTPIIMDRNHQAPAGETHLDWLS